MQRPEHPYARLPVEAVEASLEWLRVELSDLGYTGGLDENLLLTSAAERSGRPRSRRSQWPAAISAPGPRLLLVGFRAFKDFYPAYVADNLAAAGLEAGLRSSKPPLGRGEADVAGWSSPRGSIATLTPSASGRGARGARRARRGQ